jgi:hypothetical protein
MSVKNLLMPIETKEAAFSRSSWQTWQMTSPTLLQHLRIGFSIMSTRTPASDSKLTQTKLTISIITAQALCKASASHSTMTKTPCEASGSIGVQSPTSLHKT